VKRRTFLGTAAASLAVPVLAAPSIARGAAANVLKFVPQSNLTSLDPVWTTAAVTTNHAWNVYDTLYGVDHTLKPQPQMAEGHTVSSDQLTWTIKLRPGLKFHDNTPVRAADCAASLSRWAARDTFGQTMAPFVAEYKAVDDSTLAIHLHHPFPLLLDGLAKPSSSVPFIMPERIAKTDPFKQITEVIGSGPFRFLPKEYISGSRVAYEKFAGYKPREGTPSWTSGAKVAHFNRVEWHIIPDTATASAALQSGEVDWWEQVQADLIPMLKTNKNITFGIGDPTGYMGVIRFNELYPPFNNRLMREAILHAVDQKEYMAAVTGNDPKSYLLWHSFYPAKTPFGAPSVPDPMARNPDLALAKQLIAKAGYKGEKITIINPTNFATIAPFGQITYALFKKLGLNVTLDEMDWGSVVQRRAVTKPPAQGGWNVFHTWTTGMFIENPAVSPIIRGQGMKGWFGWYKSAKMEALNSQWLTAPTVAAQKKIAAQMQALAFHDAPTVPLGEFFIHTAYRKNLTGVLEGPAPFAWNCRMV